MHFYNQILFEVYISKAMFSGCKQRRIHLLLKISVVESNFGSYFSLTGCKQVGKGQAAEMLKVFMSKVIISSVFILLN